MGKINKSGFNRVSKTKLKIIENGNGNIMHALKKHEKSFSKFGEAYFSKIKYKKIKGWKYHERMKLNLIVPFGKVRFIFYDCKSKNFLEEIIGEKTYYRLTVKPKTWFAFQGLSKKESLILNIASIPHDSNEQFSVNLNKIDFNW